MRERSAHLTSAARGARGTQAAPRPLARAQGGKCAGKAGARLGPGSPLPQPALAARVPRGTREERRPGARPPLLPWRGRRAFRRRVLRAGRGAGQPGRFGFGADTAWGRRGEWRERGARPLWSLRRAAPPGGCGEGAAAQTRGSGETGVPAAPASPRLGVDRDYFFKEFWAPALVRLLPTRRRLGLRLP